MDSRDVKKKKRKKDGDDHKKMKSKKALDNCAVEKDSNTTLKDGKKSLSMEGMKSGEDDISEMPSAIIAATKKRKKGKERDEKGYDRTTKDSSENAVNVEDKMTVEKDSDIGLKDGKQSVSMEGRKAAEDYISGMPTTVATNKKRKKSKEKDKTGYNQTRREMPSAIIAATKKRKRGKEKDEKGYNQTAKDSSENAVNVEDKMTVEEDSGIGLKDGKQSVSMEGRKAAEDNISGMPSTTVATNKKRKKSKEKDETGYNQTTKGPSKILGDVEVKMAVEKDSSRSLEHVKQSLYIEGRKATQDDVSEMPSSATMTINKKRKKSKENGEKQYNQTTIGFIKSALNVEDKITRKSIQAAEAKGNKEASSIKKRKGIDDSEVSNLKKRLKTSKDDSDTSSLQKKKKKVSFSDEIEVFLVGTETGNDQNAEEPLVRGKRFTVEEDNKVREAIDRYIQTHQLGEEGMHMVLNCKKYPKLRHCWKEIGACLPHRPYNAVYFRAHILLERGEKRKWEPEEYEMVRRFYAAHGADWKTLARQLNKHRVHIKDCWRSIKLSGRNKGPWSQDEYQNLFDLVNLDLRLKAFEAVNPKHGMIRDNISWQAIGEKLSTRNPSHCCMKWYGQLTSPLVNQGLWEDIDDYRLLAALHNVDACCMEDVDWDNLLERRSGEVCKSRWAQMTRHIGGFKERPFIEQVEVLSKRYSSDMIECRETMSSLKEQRKLEEQEE